MPKIPQSDDDAEIEFHLKGCGDLLDTCGGCLIAIALVFLALIRLLIVS